MTLLVASRLHLLLIRAALLADLLRIMRLHLELPVVNSVHGQWLAHDRREACLVSRLAYLVPLDLEETILVTRHHLLRIVLYLDIKVKVLEVEECIKTTRYESQVIVQSVLIYDISGNVVLDSFED